MFALQINLLSTTYTFNVPVQVGPYLITFFITPPLLAIPSSERLRSGLISVPVIRFHGVSWLLEPQSEGSCGFANASLAHLYPDREIDRI